MTVLFAEASPQVFQKVTVGLMFHVKFAQLLCVSVLQLLTHFHLRDTADLDYYTELLQRLHIRFIIHALVFGVSRSKTNMIPAPLTCTITHSIYLFIYLTSYLNKRSLVIDVKVKCI